MNKTRRFSAAPLAFAFLGLLFSLWTLFGNEVNFCVTAGCTLYQDFKIAGVSLWVFGAASFAVFMLLAVTGFVRTGRLLSGIALLADCGLLLLMAVTAPCLNCLIVAAFFALTYRSFRLAALAGNVQRGSGPGRSWLVAAWLVLFIMNAGAVVRSETGSWAMLGSEEDASVHMYFTPGCPSCREGLAACFITQAGLADEYLDLEGIHVFPLLHENKQLSQKVVLLNMRKRKLPSYAVVLSEMLQEYFKELESKDRVHIAE